MNKAVWNKVFPHLIAIGIFLAVSSIFFLPAFNGMVLNQEDTAGWRGMAQQSFEFREKHGHYPLWTNSMFSGMPTYQIVFGKPYAVSIGFLHKYVFTLGLPEPVSYFFLASVMAYFLFIVMGVRPWVGIMGALAFAYATYNPIVTIVGHNTKMICIAYMPAVLASVLLLYQKKYVIGTVLTTLFVAMIIWQNHVQIAYYTMIMALALSVAFAIRAARNKEYKHIIVSGALALLAGAFAIGINAINLWPINEFVKETMRGGRSELVSGNQANKSKGGLDRDYAFYYGSYGITETFTLIVPRIYGGGLNGAKEFGEQTKAGEALSEQTGMPEEQADEYARSFPAYWGKQPSHSGPTYLGAIICFLFILGLVYVKSWHKWWILAAAAFGILLSWGKNLPGINYFLFDYLPVYNKFRAPSMAMVIPQLGFVMLACLALQQFLFGTEDKKELWKKLRLATFITGGVFVILIALYFSFDYAAPSDKDLRQNFANGMMQQMAQGQQQPGPELQQRAESFGRAVVNGLHEDRKSLFGGDLLRAFIFIACTIALLALYVKDKIKTPYAALAGIVLLSSIDILGVAWRYVNHKDFVEPVDFENAFASTPADIKIKADTTRQFRVFDQAAANGPFSDSRASYHHNSIGGYSPAKLALYQDIIDSQLVKGNTSVYNMLNTKYFIVRDPATGQPDAQLNPNALGNCWFVKGFRIAKNANDEMAILNTLNTRDSAVIDARFEKTAGTQPLPDSTASIRLVENLNDKVTYQSESAQPQFAVFSEVYYPYGWDAYIDGKKTDYCRVNYALRGMPVPAGKHTIEFRFEPRSVILGDKLTQWFSILFYIGLIAGLVIEFRRAKKA
ncbi:YfhO family protein [Pseudoflavitalea sp. X16]|uniref:YfhO family protein n=1 Tax=Paraflavitalea devenefica TaxID=2716334 RepID=UPI00141F2131|nr:YfhO family protein [Paraflavitalea devenefica]NII29548.1 YfhO family protein [Paraflavitalea devenefica]